MSAHAAKGVFISYARPDRGPVMLAARLLRAGGATVFLDVNDIADGDKWEAVLLKAIENCERIMVFWSQAAQASHWVQREWRAALSLNKRIVPVALDETPLPAPLAEFQGVTDLMAMLDEARRLDAPALRAPMSAPAEATMRVGMPPSRRSAPWAWVAAAGVLSLAALVGVWQLPGGDELPPPAGARDQPISMAPPASGPVPASGPAPASAPMPASGPGPASAPEVLGAPGGSPAAWLVMLALIGLAVLMWRRWRRRGALQKAGKKTGTEATGQAQGSVFDLGMRFTRAVFDEA